jgi:hypothetical protein
MVLSSQVDGSDVEFLGEAVIPGDAIDRSELTERLENGTPQNQFGGISALDYSGADDLYVALSDRGPDDGAVPYRCRSHRLRIQMHPGAVDPVQVEIDSTNPLTDESGRVFVGASSIMESTADFAGRLDPEAVRCAADGSLFVSDEYGPSISQFDRSGRLQRRFSLPSHLLIDQPHAVAADEIANNQTGRAANRGLECLALSTDQHSLVALMQGPLLQEGVRDDSGKIVGLHCRLPKLDINSGELREFVYSMSERVHGNSEILATGPDEYLVLERDSKPGVAAGFRKLIHVSLAGAAEVTGLPVLPPEVQPVKRTEFLDLLDPRWKLAGETMPEKLESLTFGPDLPDGRRLLLVVSDNDFESAFPTRVWAFAVPRAMTPL